MIDTVFLDMDGVLADFMSSALDVNKAESRGVPITHDDVTTWDCFRLWGATEDEFWEPIHSLGSLFWENLRKYPWADDIFKLVYPKRWLIATKPSRSPECCAGKMRWMHKHFNSRFSDYFFCQKKEYLARPGALLIDDSDDNVDRFLAAGGDAILFPQSWNSNRWAIGNRMSYLKEEFRRHQLRRYNEVAYRQ